VRFSIIEEYMMDGHARWRDDDLSRFLPVFRTSYEVVDDQLYRISTSKSVEPMILLIVFTFTP
jgi:hypothetical protein